MIYALEPAPQQRESLTERLRPWFGQAEIIIDGRGVGDEPRQARFKVTGGRTGDSALVAEDHSDAQGVIDIEVTTLDALCQERGYPRLDLCKVDTEGNDFNVILGARTLFDAEAVGLLQNSSTTGNGSASGAG